MSDRRATVSLPIDEWDDVRNKQQALHEKIAELTTKLAEAERRDPTGRLEPTLDTVEAAIPIIQFAVSNLHPDTVIGWPYEELHDFSQKLTTMPGRTQLHIELAIELNAFANQAERRARERAMRPPVPVEPTPEQKAETGALIGTVNAAVESRLAPPQPENSVEDTNIADTAEA